MIPYSDLHRHLDGSLRASTLTSLAAQASVELPADVRFRPGMGLAEALSRFEVTVACLQRPESVARVASEICEDAAAEGVTTLEVRFAPQLHGAPMADVVDAALEGLGGRAGLVLCALFGDPPELAEALVRLAADRPGVVGLDLAGGPSSSHAWSMLDYAPAFRWARRMGLGRTVHAGEGRPAAEIAVAIKALFAQRIGHGTTLLDDPWVTDLVKTKEIVIEACPTSNVHTGVIESLAAHPLRRWLAKGIRACVNTDNTLLSDVDAATEHGRVFEALGMDPAEQIAVIATGHAARFVRG